MLPTAVDGKPFYEGRSGATQRETQPASLARVMTSLAPAPGRRYQ
jgi:hypothetical protein